MIICQPYFNSLHRIAQRSFRVQGCRRTYHNVHQLLDESPHSRTISFNNFLHRIYKSHEIFKSHPNLDSINYSVEVAIARALKARQGNSLFGSQIHGFAITSGFNSQSLVSNSLMSMYCKSGQFSHALCIFENLTYPDIVSWNTMLSGFQRSEDAFGFACRMRSSGVIFDAFTYTTVLAFCLSYEDFLFGLQLHTCILKSGFARQIFVGNALVSMYTRCSCLLEARRLFEEMPNRDLVSWTAMLSGYAREQSYGLEAIKIFFKMVRVGIALDQVSFASAISACGLEKNLELGRQIHGLTIKRGYDKHGSVANVLMSTYRKCDANEDAKSVFQAMNDRNVVSWTTMISLNEEDAVSIFNKMRLGGVSPNEVTFAALIHSITIRNLVEGGKMVHGSCIKAGFAIDSIVSGSIITMYAKFESIHDSVKFFEELDHSEIITWNALISGYAQNGLFQEAIRTFFLAVMKSKPNQYTFGSALSAIGAAMDISMKHGQKCHCQIIKVGLDTDPVVSSALLGMYAKRGSICDSQRIFSETPQRSQFSWTSIISAHSRHGDYESVMNWFEKMKREGVKPDSITFLSVLTACGRKGMVDIGHQLFDSMLSDYIIEPSPEHYSCVVDILGRAGRLEEAEKLMNRIPGGPGLSVLQSLLGACRIHRNVEMGERIADTLMKMESAEPATYVLMSNLYAEKGEWDKVAEVRTKMRLKRMNKDVGFSWVDVCDTHVFLSLHGFSTGDKSHPQSEEIYRMVEGLIVEMKFLREKRDESLRYGLMQEGNAGWYDIALGCCESIIWSS